MSQPAYRLVIAASAERSLARLPERIAAAIVEFMLGPLVDSPQRLGHPLHRELAELWSARVGSYRVLYEIKEGTRTVAVVRIDHRADVYRAP